MQALPEDVALALVRGLGAYLHATPAVELPTSVRRFKSFRIEGMARQRKSLLALLDSEAERALILQWLDEEEPALPKADAEMLRLACERPEGWVQDLAGRSQTKEKPKPPGKDPAQAVTRERAKVRKARDELKRLRAEMERAAAVAATRLAEADQRIEVLGNELVRERERADAAAAELTRQRTEADRELRRARRAREEAEAESARSRAEVRALRPEEPAPKAKEAAGAARKLSRKRRTGPRVPLKVARGRREDDPATLASWLDRDDVYLLVDGYNVTKAGYPELSLEAQRDRLTNEATNLATRKKLTGTIVFDGSEGSVRRPKASKGPLRIVFSAPGEIADDRLIAILDELPPIPVVFVTNDRELRSRAEVRGATIATSEQLLGLLR